VASEPIVDSETLARSVRRIAAEIVETALQSGARGDLAIIGIRRGGVPIARRIADEIERSENTRVDVGAIDIGLYRDDAATAMDPQIEPSEVTFPVEGRDVVLVDDVLQTGRTVRAAIDHLLDYGRPRRVWLAVLFDRGGRELPIAADFVGRSIELASGARLEVDLDRGAFVKERR
jgi:pyrimidine operon attenuation protein / uracil phosphoribosyltransferase